MQYSTGPLKTVVFFLAIAVTLTAGCGSSGGGADSVDDDANTAFEDAAVVDLKDVVLEQRSGDCADYTNTYEAAVLDISRSLGFEAQVYISSDEDSCTLRSNGIPNHDFNDLSASFATDVADIESSFSLSRYPIMAASPTALSQQSYDAIMLNGVVLDILSAGCYSPSEPMADANGNTPVGCQLADGWILDPLSPLNGFGTDQHNAHTQPDGRYHYHGNPIALFDDNPGPNGSPVIGFAADGYPIYGSYFLDEESGAVRKALSGYSLKSGSRGVRDNDNPGGNYDGTYIDDWEYTAAGDLDECNGMTVNGQYAYYVVDSYPWVIACFRGSPDLSFNK